MKYQGNTDGYRGGYDASMHVDDAVYPTQWGYVPLDPLAASARQIQPGRASPNPKPQLPRPTLQDR